jgi:serine/threonine protein kinase
MDAAKHAPPDAVTITDHRPLSQQLSSQFPKVGSQAESLSWDQLAAPAQRLQAKRPAIEALVASTVIIVLQTTVTLAVVSGEILAMILHASIVLLALATETLAPGLLLRRLGPSRRSSEPVVIPRYRVRQRIGAGGMGEVYLAEHIALGRPCAIKVIRPSRVDDPISQARFEREARSAAKLCHANIVSVYDAGQLEDGTFFCCMEYLNGLTLHDLVDDYGRLPAARVVYLMEQACAALSQAHQHGLVHRDLKPANIFTTVNGEYSDVVKLLDFGLVKPLGIVSALTHEGTITGSPLYLSPEQATGEVATDERSDIYSLGAVMYFLLTGQPPFSDGATMQILLAHANRPPIAVSERNSDVSPELETLVMRCLAKSPADRFDSAAELADALRGCSEHGLWTEATASDWWSSRSV